MTALESSAGIASRRPSKPAVHMSWTDLLFLHWRVPVEAVERVLPAGVEVDRFDGETWIGLVPFTMTDCVFRGFRFVPGLRTFHECNVRVYVRAGGRAGVWFLSLDAANLLPVVGGRLGWNLNYVYSRFDVSHSHGSHRYALRRRAGPWPVADTMIRWQTGARLPVSEPGSLEHFLTERYWLFTRKRNRLYAGRSYHDPWPLHEAEVQAVDAGLLRAAGFDGVTDGNPVALASHRIDVVGNGLVPLDAVRDR